MKTIIKNGLIIGRPNSIADLRTVQNAFALIDIRDKFKILVYDDEGFPYFDTFRNEGFNIQCHQYFEDLTSASEYPIVICDINGVGTRYDPDRGGAYVLRELKKKYPFKQYAAYSGFMYNLEIMKELNGVPIISKCTDIDTWRQNLDELIRRAADPIENWKSVRTFLLEKEVPLIEVLKMEHNFVDAVRNKDEKIRDFPSKKEFPDLSQDIRSIINNLIAAGIVRLIETL